MLWTVRVNTQGGLIIHKTMRDAIGLVVGDKITYDILRINNKQVDPIRLTGSTTRTGYSLMVVVSKPIRDKLGLDGGDIVTIDVREITRRRGSEEVTVWKNGS